MLVHRSRGHPCLLPHRRPPAPIAGMARARPRDGTITASRRSAPSCSPRRSSRCRCWCCTRPALMLATICNSWPNPSEGGSLPTLSTRMCRRPLSMTGRRSLQRTSRTRTKTSGAATGTEAFRGGASRGRSTGSLRCLVAGFDSCLSLFGLFMLFIMQLARSTLVDP